MPRSSSRRRPSQDRSKDTVEAILQGAVQVLLNEGYAALTTNRIAERAGVSVGSLYQYFANKQAIIEELCRRQIDEARQLFERNLRDVDLTDLSAAITLVLDRVLESFDEEHIGVFSAVMTHLPAGTELAIIDQSELYMEAVFGEVLAQSDQIDVPDPHMTATLLVRTFGGIVRATLRRNPEQLRSPELRAEWERWVRLILGCESASEAR